MNLATIRQFSPKLLRLSMMAALSASSVGFTTFLRRTGKEYLHYWLIVTFELTMVIDFFSTVAGVDCATATVDSVPKFDQQLIGL